MVPWYFEHALLLSLPVAAAIVALGAFAVIYIGGYQARRQAKERRRQLGEPIAELRPPHEDTVVTVIGTLRVVEGPCDRYENGQPAAATTFEVSSARTRFEAPEFEASSHRRAKKLRLVVGDTHAELDGPLCVGVGSREYFPASEIQLTDDVVAHAVQGDGGFDPRECEGFAVYRSLSDGDEVIARCTASRSKTADARAVGYRGSALSWRLHPGSALAVEVASRHAPAYRTPRSLLAAGPALVVAAAVVGYTAMFIEVDREDLDRACDRTCFERGECTPIAWWGTFGVGTDCRQMGELHCERRRDCLELGHCSDIAGVCGASEREHCLPTDGCEQLGRCTPRQGRCRVGDDADCAQSAECRELGHCTAYLDAGICGVGSDADCEKRADCRLRGLCSNVDGRCGTAKPKDCLGTRYCEEEGLCSFDPVKRLCIAATDEDCLSADACARAARCYAVEGVCVQ